MLTGELVTQGAAERSIGARDDELVRLAASGDRDAFDRLIRTRLDKLYRIAVAITRSESDARDATQDACVLAWRELPRLREHEKFDSWLAQILVNAARGAVRKAGRIQVRELSLEPEADGRRTAREPMIAAEADSLADSDAIRRAFARLDGAARTLIVLHYVEHKPLADIAQLTGSPLGTVKWRLSNARAALEKALKAERR